jgi:hypothetical protein
MNIRLYLQAVSQNKPSSTGFSLSVCNNIILLLVWQAIVSLCPYKLKHKKKKNNVRHPLYGNRIVIFLS